MFWIGGRLQEMVADGGSTLLFSLLSTYIAIQKRSGHSAPVRLEWHDVQSTREVS